MEPANEIAIVGVCGAHFPYFVKDKKEANERILLDFARLYNVFHENPETRNITQTWLSSIIPKNHHDAFRTSLHEPNNDTSLTLVRRGKLCGSFTSSIWGATRECQHIVIVISAHGGEDTKNPYVLIGGMQFDKARLEQNFKPAYLRNRRVTLIMTSCTSGGSWLSEHWTLYTTAVAVGDLQFFPYNYFEETGSITAGEREQKDEDENDKSRIRSEQVKDYVVRWSKHSTVERVLSYHELPIAAVESQTSTEPTETSVLQSTPPTVETAPVKPESTPSSYPPEPQIQQPVKEAISQKKQEPSRLDLLVRYHIAGLHLPSNCCSERFLVGLLHHYLDISRSPHVCQALEEELNFRLMYDRKALDLLSVLGYKASIIEFLAWDPHRALRSSKYIPMLKKWKERSPHRRSCSYDKPLQFVGMILETKLKPSHAEVMKAVGRC